MDSPGTNQFLMPLGAPITRNYNAGSADLSSPGMTQYARNTNNPKFGGNSFDLGVPRDSIKPVHVKSINANQISAGTVLVSLNVGSTSGGYVLIDGPNNRILVNDGTTNRIVIGSV